MKISDCLEMARRELKDLTPRPYQEGLWLLGKILKAPSSEIHLKSWKSLNPEQKGLFLEMLRQRREQQPLDYVLEEAVFFGQTFSVRAGVFIPRPDTEIIVERVLGLCSPGGLAQTEKNPAGKECGSKKNGARVFKMALAGKTPRPALRAADFGAGAGPICLSLLRAIPNSRFAALEINPKALECLKKNSRSLGVSRRIHILQKDVSRAEKREIASCLGGAPDLITANPPYIAPDDETLERGVYLHEPPLALFSDQEGMGHIYSWFEKAVEILRPGGSYLFEFGYNQSERVQKFLGRQSALSSYKILKDRGGRDRAALCLKAGGEKGRRFPQRHC